MASQRLSENLINICIVPKSVCWPEASAATAWARAHDCVTAFKDLVRNLDLSCIEVEQTPDLSASAIARRRTELCERALIQLVNFKPFEIAEGALSESIGSLERLSYRDSQQVETHRTLTQALMDLREGVEATKRLVRERCKLRGVLQFNLAGDVARWCQ